MARKALIRLLRRVWPKRSAVWWRFAYSRSGDPSVAEDILQEAVVRVLEADPAIEDTGETDAYIMRAIRSVLIDRARARGKRNGVRRVLEKEPGRGVSPGLRDFINGEERALRRRVYRIATRRLRTMPAHLREAFELYVLANPPHTFEEIAEIQGVAKSTASRRVTHALELLADSVMEELDDA